MSNTDSVTLFQTQLVKIESDVLGQEKDDTVVLPLAFPFGDDWKYLNAEKFMVDYADIMIAPYYDQATLINKNAGEGVVTGNFPVYMSIYAGNTMNENESLELSQMIYSGVYVTGSQNSTTKVELKGTVFKTLVDEVEKIKDKQNELHKMMDSSLLKNELVKLQLGRVAIGIRKSDFIASANSKNAENSTQVYNRMMAVHRKKPEEKEVKKIVKGKVVRGPLGSEPDTMDKPKDGKLMAIAGFYVTTKIQIRYVRQPPSISGI